MTGTNLTALPEEIQAIAAQHWKLFPLGSEGEARKRPAITDWPKLASCDLNQLRSWTQQFPNCNWAVLTGEESGVFALDLDGIAGERWLDQKITSCGVEWMATRQVVTGSGGTHLYFLWPSAVIHNSTG